MNRNKMLKKLHTVKFKYINPPSDWEDIGFTESDIWVNSEGYGYLACDEPNGSWVGSGLPKKKWQQIKHKLLNEELQIDDLRDTPLIELFELFYCFDDDEYDSELVCEVLQGLLELDPFPNKQQILYCMQEYDELLFFNNKEKFIESYERDDYDYSWDELSDDMLLEWIKRLS